MSWQPIETAPKDGTVVLLATRTSVEACSWNPSIHGEDYPWVIFEDLGDYTPSGCCDREDRERIKVNGAMEDWPTHWQPLPQLPENPND